MTAPHLGAASAKATIERSGIDPNAIDEVIFGNTRGKRASDRTPRVRSR